MNNNDIIDIVVPWVDGSDPEWQKEFRKYSSLEMGRDDNSEIRYRDWDNLQYLFRGIEKFTPWVNKVHLITNGQKPKWLNMNAPKLNFVRHGDFIPKEWLPTFSVRPIELNLHKIDSLAEQFIYFNDDYFLLRPVKKERFFKNGLPCDMAILDTLPVGGTRGHVMMNCLNIAIKHFNKNKVLRANPQKWFNPIYGTQLFRTFALLPFSVFPGFRNHHMPQAYLKSTFREVWNAEKDLLMETSMHRFRDITDVNQSVMRYWQFMSGKFYPYNVTKGTLRAKSMDSGLQRLVDIIANKKCDVLVTYDSDDIVDFSKSKKLVNDAFESILPQKSSFEL